MIKHVSRPPLETAYSKEAWERGFIIMCSTCKKGISDLESSIAAERLGWSQRRDEFNQAFWLCPCCAEIAQ